MRSEIPQLQVITAIADAEVEDFVAQLLYSQGWSIIFRAIDSASLLSSLVERGGVLRTVVVYRSDLPEWSEEKAREIASPMITLICLDGVEITSHSLMSHIRGQLRLPMIHQQDQGEPTTSISLQQSQTKKPSKVVSVTGTSGSPGRSHLALSLAQYLSWQRKVHLIDADLRAPSLAYLKGSQSKNNSGDREGRYQLTTLDLSTKPTTPPLQDQANFHLSILDIGALGPLEEVVNDRRWQATLIHNILESSTSLIYVVRSSGLGLLRLERFISEFPVLLRKIPIIYVLSQGANSRVDRGIESRFNSLTSGEERCIFPFDSGANLGPSKAGKSGFLDFGKGNSKVGKEIGRIAELIS